MTPAELPGRPGALRRRLARLLLGLTLSAAAVLGCAYWAVESYVERQSLSHLLSDELDHRLAESAPATPGRPGDMVRFFRGADSVPLPEGLRALGPGAYDDIRVDGRSYRVLVRDVAPHDRVYLLNDIGPLALRERQLLLLLILGVGVVGLMAWFVSARLASLALEPLERLGRAIRSLDPARRDARLALEQDQDLRGIGIVFNEHLAALERLTQRELAFAASVSHELRTHLAVIENTVELVSLKLPDASGELQRIERAARRARNDLDALLAMARHQPIELGDILLEPLLREVAAEVSAGVAMTTILRWETMDACPAFTSARTIAIVFSNLLRNALIAAGPAGTVTIAIDDTGFSVSDNGPGLPAGDWARLFEPWFEGRNGGSGLGLFIAHTLMIRLGGTLALAPAMQGGLVATVRLAAGNTAVIDKNNPRRN